MQQPWSPDIVRHAPPPPNKLFESSFPLAGQLHLQDAQVFLKPFNPRCYRNREDVVPLRKQPSHGQLESMPQWQHQARVLFSID